MAKAIIPDVDLKSSETKSTVNLKYTGISQEVTSELNNEINNMLSFAIYNGIIINTGINELIQNSNVEDLINAHNLLCKNIAPATPKSIAYTKKVRQEGDHKSSIRKLPLVRNLIILAILFLAAFVITSTSADVNNDSLDLGIMNNHGLSLLLNLGFLVSVSGLGVLFFLLKEVSTSVKNSTLIPEESISYIAQIVLGIIAGLLMSEVISFYSVDTKSINLLDKTFLALFGGFSSDAIFSILQGIINKIKSLFIS